MSSNMIPRFGERAPDFALLRGDGTVVHLADLIAEKTLVLFFYPRDETAGCTIEACAFRDAYLDFVTAGAEVVGVSRDDAESHRRFATAHKLPFPLLTDADGSAHDRYGVQSRLGGLVKDRATFIIDRQGIVRLVFTSKLRFAMHSTKALDLVRALNEHVGAGGGGREI